MSKFSEWIKLENYYFRFLERFLLFLRNCDPPRLMSFFSSKPRLNPASTVAATLIAVALGGLWLAPAAQSQAPDTSTPNAALTVLLTKLKTQQTQIVANQTKIEAQTALLKEEIRQAKIYSARAGSGRR